MYGQATITRLILGERYSYMYWPRGERGVAGAVLLERQAACDCSRPELDWLASTVLGSANITRCLFPGAGRLHVLADGSAITYISLRANFTEKHNLF